MREFVIQSGKGEQAPATRTAPAEEAPVRTAAAPRSTTPLNANKAEARKTSKPVAARAAKQGQRSFVVGYKGNLVGFFEAESQLTPREAFLRVAADMAARDPSFESSRLEIYKPVPIKSARPPEDQHLFRGKLRCVRAKKRHR